MHVSHQRAKQLDMQDLPSQSCFGHLPEVQGPHTSTCMKHTRHNYHVLCGTTLF